LKRRIILSSALAAAALGLALLASCDYAAPDPSLATGGSLRPGYIPSNSNAKVSPLGTAANNFGASPRAQEERTAILESSITLIQRAALQPGGDNFRLAVQKLNHYFEGTSPSEYQLGSLARMYLQTQLPAQELNELENRTWSLRDARHLEDCMMYYGIANRVAGTGEELGRVRRVFDWAMRQVQLVPAGSLRAERLGQAYARPYDVLLRGMATEAEGFWAERAWLFMALCRQLGIDTGLVAYTKHNSLELVVPRYAPNIDIETALIGVKKPAKSPIIWICTALIDDKAYLFDARLGLEIPGPDGDGVATLEQALTDSAILERMSLQGLSPYGTSRASLLSSPNKINIMLDSSPGYFSPKMKLLQGELVGNHRTILYKDPVEQRDHFAQVLGQRLGGVRLWGLPYQVLDRLFKDPRFVESIQASLFVFGREFPLVYARVKQLRGELDEAIPAYVKLRGIPGAPLVTDKKKTIPKDVQDALDIYATYYLGLAHLDRNDSDQAEREHNLEQAAQMFKRTLELLPEPGPNQPFYNMFRWGANANLGRIYEARKDYRTAIAYYGQRDPTYQFVGNQLRARELVWRDPMAAPPDKLTPAPKPSAISH
jgi:tetratricopeptide (TPR) repeat protein